MISRDYNTVPPLRRDDKVLPTAAEIPAMLSSIRRRKRTISVGPQSEADAREFIAARQQHRQDEKAAAGGLRPKSSNSSLKAPTTPSIAEIPNPLTPSESPESGSYLIPQENTSSISASSLQVDGPYQEILTPPASENGNLSDSGKEDEKNDQKMFSSLEKPRIRYDVEVITKLVVYAGIAWLAVEGNPLLFAKLGIQ